MTTGKKIALGVGCGLPLLCCVGGGLVLQATVGRVAGGLDAQIAAAKKEGIPLTPEDLNAIVKVPDDQNAAPFYSQAIAMLKDRPKVGKVVSAVSSAAMGSPKPEDAALAESSLPTLDPLYALLEKATQKPRCDWNRDWSKGSNILFPEFSTMRNFSRITTYRAEQRSANGDWQGALHDIAMSAKISQHAGDDPILIGMLVQSGDEAITVHSFNRIILEHKDDARFLTQARKVFDGLGPLPNFRRSLLGEVVMGRATIRSLNRISDLTGNPSDDQSNQSNRMQEMVMSNPLVRNAFDAKFIEAYRTLLRAVPDGGENWSIAAKATSDVSKKIEADHSFTNTINRIMLPVFGQAATAIGRNQANRRLTDVTLRLLAEHAKTGKYPAVLPDFGELGIDPFSGAPLHYRAEDKGFRLYSVGVDGKDDGGKPMERGHFDQNHDEVIVVK